MTTTMNRCERCGHESAVIANIIAAVRDDRDRIQTAAIALLNNLEAERLRSWDGWALAVALQAAFAEDPTTTTVIDAWRRSAVNPA